MFEHLVSSVLVKVLGDYIQDLDPKSLGIGIWKGEVDLNNLRLKESALDIFDLPISVVHGYVGNINAKIPWSSLGSSPVQAQISDLFIVVQPKKCVAWSDKVERERSLQMKRKKLENYETLKALKESTDLNLSSNQKSNSFTFFQILLIFRRHLYIAPYRNNYK